MPESPTPFRGEHLVVRQHERVRCALGARVLVAAESAERVALAVEGVGQVGQVTAVITDCSRGGLGLSSPVYLPKRCRVVVRVEGVAGKGGAAGVIEVTAVVQRAAMLDRKPTYYLGLSAANAGDMAAMQRLVEWAKESESVAAGAGAAGVAGVAGPRGGGAGVKRA